MERDRNLDTVAEWNFINGFQRSVTWQSHDQVISTWSFQLGADSRLWARDTLNATVQYRGIRINIMRVEAAVNYGAGVTGGRRFTQGAANGAGTATQAAGDNGDSGVDTTLKYLHLGTGRRVEELGAYSYSRSFTAGMNNGHFDNMPATITGLVIRGDGVGETGGAIPARYTATRGGAPLNYQGETHQNAVADSAGNGIPATRFSTRRGCCIGLCAAQFLPAPRCVWLHQQPQRPRLRDRQPSLSAGYARVHAPAPPAGTCRHGNLRREGQL